MKIGFVIDDTLDSSDGVQQYVTLLGGWFQDKGHEVHYLTGEASRQDIANIHSLSRNIKARFNKNRLTIPLPTPAGRIKKLLHSHDFDILHVQMPYSPMMAGKAIKLADTRTAVVATYHIAPHSQMVTAANRLLGLLQKRSLARIDKLISVSPVARSFAKQVTGKTSEIIPNAIDTRLWRPQSQSDPEYDIVFVGRLVSRKGCIYLLQAINRLLQHDSKLKLKVAIAGAGPELEHLKHYVVQHNLSKHVKFLGYVSEENKRSLLQTSRIAIFPSTGGESFGIVLLEAMAAGAVVLAGDNPGYRSVIGPADGSLVNPHDTERFADTINDLLSNNAKMARLGRTQHKLLKQYDIETVGSAILAVYQDVIAAKGA